MNLKPTQRPPQSYPNWRYGRWTQDTSQDRPPVYKAIMFSLQPRPVERHGCKRCGGTMNWRADEFGVEYRSCIQSGHTVG